MSRKIALGAMMFGWKVSLIDALKITDTAIENGIDIVDTSPSYGNGLSEIICGHLINKYPNIKISTKFSLPTNISMDELQNFIIKSCYESLTRLSSEKLNIYVLHNDLNIPDIDMLCDTILLLKDKKIIENFFISNTTLNTYSSIKNFEIKNRVSIIDGAQLKKNFLFTDSIFNKVTKGCIEKVFTYSPLCEGVLTGKYLSSKLPHNSRLSQVTRHSIYYEKLLSAEITEKVLLAKNQAENKKLSLVEYSYIKLFSSKLIDKVIIGPSKLKHLKEAIRCEELSNQLHSRTDNTRTHINVTLCS